MLFELALGATKEERVFFELKLDETINNVPPNPTSRRQKRKNRFLLIRDSKAFQETKVKVTTLDFFYKKNAIARIDFLKNDVEEFEYEVLKGQGML